LGLKKDLDALASEREAKLRACAPPIPEKEQRSQYLAGFRIEDAKLANIGTARCAVLRSWGIDTAADVEEAKINEIPGFGRALTDKIVLWRERIEQAFICSAMPTIDPLVAQRIDRQLAVRRTALMKELRERIGEVEHRVSGHMKMRQALWAEIESALEAKMASTPTRVFLVSDATCT
jgi:DNA-binding helix-hairpin-helix protein with protein kinase domain